jgi:hypothetical protein
MRHGYLSAEHGVSLLLALAITVFANRQGKLLRMPEEAARNLSSAFLCRMFDCGNSKGSLPFQLPIAT